MRFWSIRTLLTRLQVNALAVRHHTPRRRAEYLAAEAGISPKSVKRYARATTHSTALNIDDGATALQALRTVVSVSTFYTTHHQIIFTHLCALADAGRPLTYSTLAESLHASGELDEIGGEPALMLLETEGVMAAMVPTHAAELVTLALKREASAAFKSLAAHVDNGGCRPLWQRRCAHSCPA